MSKSTFTAERPLAEVLARNAQDFTPEHPRCPPWHQPTLRKVQRAYTGNVVTVPLEVADRVHLHHLDRPSDERDDLEPGDWMPVGWAVAP